MPNRLWMEVWRRVQNYDMNSGCINCYSRGYVRRVDEFRWFPHVIGVLGLTEMVYLTR